MLDAVSRLLFEDLHLLLMAEVFALAVVLAVHRRRLTVKSRRLVWITLALCVLLVVIQELMVTQREAVIAMIEELAAAADDGDVSAIAERLDDGFGYGRSDKQSFVAEIHQRLQRWQIDEARVGRFEVEVEGDRATASFTGTCDWRGGGQEQYGVYSVWNVECLRTDAGWKLSRIVSAKVGPAGRFDLRDVWNY